MMKPDSTHQKANPLSVTTLLVCLFCAWTIALTPGTSNAAEDNSPVATPDPPESPDEARGWERPVVHNDVVYFLFDVARKLERFDLASQSWLATTQFTLDPLSIAVDASGVYITFADRMSNYSLDMQTETAIAGIPGGIEEVFLFEGFIVVVVGGDIETYPKVGGAMIDEIRLVSIGSSQHSFDRESGNIFGRRTGSTPQDILAGNVDALGMLTTYGDSPYHGSFPNALWTQVMQDGDAVVESSGTVYNAADLTFRGALGSPVLGIAESESEVIVLRGDQIVRMDQNYRELAVAPAAFYARSIVYFDGQLFQFGGNLVDRLFTASLLAEIESPFLEPVQTPTNFEFAALDVEYVNSGRLVFLNAENQAAHRFDLGSYTWKETSPLSDTPLDLAVDAENGEIRVSNALGRVSRVPPLEGIDEHFVTQPYPVQSLGVFGGFTLVCDDSGSWQSHWFYAQDSTNTDWVQLNSCPSDFGWSPAKRRIFYIQFRSPTDALKWEEIDTNGIMIGSGDVTIPNIEGIAPPVEVKPDDDYIVLGSGHILDGDSLGIVNQIPTEPRFMAWLNDSLHTLSEDTGTPGQSELIRWNQEFGNDGQVTLAGAPMQLVAFGNLVYAVTQNSERVHIIPISASMDSSDLSVAISGSTEPLSPGQNTGYVVDFVNNGPLQAEAEMRASQSGALGDASWVCEDNSGSFSCGDGMELIETRTLQPGDWFRLVATGQATTESILARATITPVSGLDIELRNNSSRLRMPTTEEYFESSFE